MDRQRRISSAGCEAAALLCRVRRITIAVCALICVLPLAEVGAIARKLFASYEKGKHPRCRIACLRSEVLAPIRPSETRQAWPLLAPVLLHAMRLFRYF